MNTLARLAGFGWCFLVVASMVYFSVHLLTNDRRWLTAFQATFALAVVMLMAMGALMVADVVTR